MKLIKLLLLFCLAGVTGIQYVHGEQAPEPVPASTAAGNEPSTTEVNSEEVVEESGVNSESPAGKLGSLGDAFKNFRPSEEISADNPVPFPVDI